MPSTTLAAMMASRYSVLQSSAVAAVTRGSAAWTTPSPRTAPPASSRMRTRGAKSVEAGQHQSDRVTVPRRHQLDGGVRQAGPAQAGRQRGVNGARGTEAIGAAAQDHRITGLEAKPAGIRGHVGPAFVDHADDAER